MTLGGKKISVPDLSKDFHVFGCEFTPEAVKFYCDGKLVRTVELTSRSYKDGKTKALDFPLGDQNIWLTCIASPLGGTKAVDDTKLPAVAEFDYVRVYEKR